jgi:hypothetical protein
MGSGARRGGGIAGGRRGFLFEGLDGLVRVEPECAGKVRIDEIDGEVEEEQEHDDAPCFPTAADPGCLRAAGHGAYWKLIPTPT